MLKKTVTLAILGIIIFSTTLSPAPFIEERGKNAIKIERVNERNDKLSIAPNERGNKKSEYWAVVIGIGDYKGKHDLPLNETYIYDALLAAKNWNSSMNFYVTSSRERNSEIKPNLYKQKLKGTRDDTFYLDMLAAEDRFRLRIFTFISSTATPPAFP